MQIIPEKTYRQNLRESEEREERDIANIYGCSYGQVYAWVRKYKDKGIEGLYDRRGKNKAISQLSDIEKLKAENRLLKAQTQQQQMEIDFLKKLDEIERR